MDISELNKSNPFRHPWELSRAGNIISLINKYALKGPFADIGAGDLFFASRLKRAAKTDVIAIDEAYSSWDPANDQGILILSGIDELKGSAVRTAILLDVLEHVENEKVFLSQIAAVLPPDGKVVLTVPAYNFLFSANDIFLKHKRRYTISSLRLALAGTGFEVSEYFYFYFLLFLFRAGERLLTLAGFPSYSRNAVSNWRRSESSGTTIIFKFLLDLDFAICKTLSSLKIQLPGLSLCAVLKRTSL